MYVCTPRAYLRTEECDGSLETEAVGSYELPYGCWVLNLGSLEDYPVLLTSKPYLQSTKSIFLQKTKMEKRKSFFISARIFLDF